MELTEGGMKGGIGACFAGWRGKPDGDGHGCSLPMKVGATATTRREATAAPTSHADLGHHLPNVEEAPDRLVQPIGCLSP
jgi:hypothetical protein